MSERVVFVTIKEPPVNLPFCILLQGVVKVWLIEIVFT